MKSRTKLALLGAPVVSACFLNPNYSCPSQHIVWDGRNADGTSWDGGEVLGCAVFCTDAGGFGDYSC